MGATTASLMTLSVARRRNIQTQTTHQVPRPVQLWGGNREWRRSDACRYQRATSRNGRSMPPAAEWIAPTSFIRGESGDPSDMRESNEPRQYVSGVPSSTHACDMPWECRSSTAFGVGYPRMNDWYSSTVRDGGAVERISRSTERTDRTRLRTSGPIPGGHRSTAPGSCRGLGCQPSSSRMATGGPVTRLPGWAVEARCCTFARQSPGPCRARTWPRRSGRARCRAGTGGPVSPVPPSGRA